MELQPNPRVVSAQRTGDGVLIEFDDGNAAFYPASLLAEVFPQALPLEELDPDEA